MRLGVLDLCRDTPGALTSDQLADGLVLRRRRYPCAAERPDDQPLDGVLHPGLDDLGPHLAEVHQATGMVSVQAGVSLDEALLLLRAQSFATERTLFAVACDVVARTLRFDPEPGES